MFQYVIKRIIIFIPTLAIISLLAFGLSKTAPGDPVELLIRGGMGAGDAGQRSDLIAADRTYQEKAEQLGLDKPAFYFSLSSAAYPDTLYKIPKQAERETLSRLVAENGNWNEISNYYHTIRNTQLKSFEVPDTIAPDQMKKVRVGLNDLLLNPSDIKINKTLGKMEKAVAKDSTLNALFASQISTLKSSYSEVKTKATPNKNYIPGFKWYGFDNQYHNWITKFLVGDFGLSYLDSRPVADKMKDALKWTLIMNFFAILIAYLVSIPLGVHTAVKKDSRFDQVSTVILFILYSLPSFWVATILIVFFTTPDYGAWTNWFPTGGLGDLASDAPFFSRFMETGYHLILPIFCITYGSLAFISRQMRGGMLSVIRQDYIRTAKAKGLDDSTITWKHAFRNSLFPIITLFASIFPRALAGSIVIEVIFSIPGMGSLAYGGIIARDWPIVFTVLMLGAILTMVGNLVADMLYAVVDPRVSYTSKA